MGNYIYKGILKNSITNDDSNYIKEISINEHENPISGHKLNDLLEKAQNLMCKIEYFGIKGKVFF